MKKKQNFFKTPIPEAKIIKNLTENKNNQPLIKKRKGAGENFG